MRFGTLVGVDYDGARYCLDCAPVPPEQAEAEGNGGYVLAGQDIEHHDTCDECGKELDA